MLEILAVLVMFFLIRATVVEAIKIPSSSMENSLLVGDFVITEKLTYGGKIPLLGLDVPGFGEVRRGDVVVFLYPKDRVTRYIKRCVAVGGDTVEIVNKQLFVNGERASDAPGAKYIDTTRSGRQRVIPPGSNGVSRDSFGPYVVPPGTYFMMGDNRDNSADSRYWGPVAEDLIIGRARLIHFSWDGEVSPAPEISVSDPLSVPRAALHNVVHFFEKVRWSRILSPVS